MNTASILLLIIFISAAVNGCSGDEATGQEEKQPVLEPFVAVDERLRTADSLVIVFFKDPFGDDSLRYTRYYTQISIIDSVGLGLLQKQLTEKAEKLEKYRNCRGEGKIWCYSKGKIFQTVYFSNRCNDCCHVYLIKDGFFYYSGILASFTLWLSSLKPLSKEPLNEGIIDNR